MRGLYIRCFNALCFDRFTNKLNLYSVNAQDILCYHSGIQYVAQTWFAGNCVKADMG